MSQNVQGLFQASHAMGDLTARSLQALNGIVDIGAQIQAGLGMPADQVQTSEVVLTGFMPDDSGSIRFAGNAQAVREGHNLLIDEMSASKQANTILFHTRYLNGHILNPFMPIAQALRMDAKNYDPCLGTPLYEQTIVFLGTMLAKYQECSDNGISARTISLLLSDGADTSSGSPKKVRSVVTDMLKQERHIIAAMGVDDGGGTDFRVVFREMGIPDEWIMTPKDAKEMRRAFRLFSQSAVRASQSAANFTQTAMGGFGAP